MITELLRQPGDVAERCRDSAAQRDVARIGLVLITVGGALFGAVLGTFRGGAQVAVSALKIPAATAQLEVMRCEQPTLERRDVGATARLQLRAASLAQLEALRAREHAALVELVELCELLRAQHLLSRLGGSERAGELRDELWTRVQALSELEA